MINLISDTVTNNFGSEGMDGHMVNIIFPFARVRRSTNILEYKLIFKRRVYLVVIVVSLRLFIAVNVGL